MCDYCNPDSDKCCIWIDPLTNDPYLDIETSKWDEYDDGFGHQREYISYCPYCGKKLSLHNQQLEDLLYHQYFENGRCFQNENIDSCNLHSMTHEETEILGQFCDITAIGGEKLKRILIKGYLADVRGE